MMEITAATIKTLRKRTSAGMMDCKRALEECRGDMEASIDWLRQKGHARVAKKASREANEGLIAVAAQERRGVLLELSSETDFAARNDVFKEAAAQLAQLALELEGDQERLLAANVPNGQGTRQTYTVKDHIVDLAARIGENISLKRVVFLEAPSGGLLASYVHNKQSEHLGKIGVLAAFSKGTRDIAHKIAMHISAAQPIALTREDIDPALIVREREVLIAQAQEEGKPENIIEKMVEGRLKKFYQDTALVEQEFILDEELSVGELLDKEDAHLSGFFCFVLGEG